MSRWLYPVERRFVRRRLARNAAAVALVLLLLLFALPGLDRWLYHGAYVGDARLADLGQRDWYRTLRVVGTLWLWVPLCLAWFVASRTERGRDSAVRALAAAAVSGVAASIVEFLAGRLRPNQSDGVHAFRGVLERFGNTRDLAFPSSHAAVAFGAAFLVWFVSPRAGVIALLMACGCGWTRMLSGAHYATDVLGAAVLGYALARLIRPGGWFGARQGPLLP